MCYLGRLKNLLTVVCLTCIVDGSFSVAIVTVVAVLVVVPLSVTVVVVKLFVFCSGSSRSGSICGVTVSVYLVSSLCYCAKGT